jgi:hypothetical protein
MDQVENIVSTSNSIVVKVCIPCHCMAMATVSLFVLRPLPSNKSIHHNMLYEQNTQFFNANMGGIYRLITKQIILKFNIP